MSLLLVELNEINFDIVDDYLKDGYSLPNFKRLLDSGFIRTFSESKYEELEPWIQWPSVHTGKTYSKHRVFHLGDIVKSKPVQVFEKVEQLGFSVGAISPMNAHNNLKSPAFFIPDPWTYTPTDGSWRSNFLYEGISQAVNDNAESKLKFSSIVKLAISTISILPIPKLLSLVGQACSAVSKSYKRAIFLDKLLLEIFISLLNKNKTDFGTLFLNAGAHVQHHYMLSSAVVDEVTKNPNWYVGDGEDPLFELLSAYDKLLGRLSELRQNGYELLIATGLSQVPYTAPTFYYRLKDHSFFLDILNITYERVEPRMTRDFSVFFVDNIARDSAITALKEITVRDTPLFGYIDILDKEIFVSMDYPNEILKECRIDQPGLSDLELFSLVNFVAIKNGKHCGQGYVFLSDSLYEYQKEQQDSIHVSQIHTIILDYFSNKH